MFCFWNKKRKRRTPTMPLFGQPHKNSLHVLKNVVDVSAMISPKPIIHLEQVDGAGAGGVGANDKAGGGRNKTRHVYLSQAVRRHLEGVYNGLRGRDKTLSREKLAAFLGEVQGEDTAAALPLDKDAYRLEEFLEMWWIQYGWDALRPPPAMAGKDLSKPITNYFISSSHNTYLSGNQLAGRSSAEAYTKVLSRGCRCIEIDVWNGDSSGSRTPARSESARPAEHRRHLSSGSLPSVAASVLESMEDRVERVRARLSGHSRNASGSQSNNNGMSAMLGTSPGRAGAHSLDPNALAERLARPRSRSRSRARTPYPRSEPIVMHGWTLTSPVGFRVVCKAIREAAFVTNPLPIIVSLEVHCDMEQQEVMVDIMKEEWKGVLVEEPDPDCDPKTCSPRLDQLLNRILVKVKKAPSHHHHVAAIVAAAAAGVAGNSASSNHNGSGSSNNNNSNNKAGPDNPVPTGASTLSSTLSPAQTLEDDLSGSEDERGGAPNAPAKARKVPICEALSKLAVYTHSEHFVGSFDNHRARQPSHIFSISETRILELHASSLQRRREMFAHNRDYFMRAFPKGTRVDSSNPDPSLFWRKGVQMVAMNWQSWDEGMMLNEGMFAGEQGWVLKPHGYLSEDRPNALATAVGAVAGTSAEARALHQLAAKTLDLTITVLAGQHIPVPEGQREKAFRPYVKFELHVERPEERVEKVEKTEKTDKADNPRASNGHLEAVTSNNVNNSGSLSPPQPQQPAQAEPATTTTTPTTTTPAARPRAGTGSGSGDSDGALAPTAAAATLSRSPSPSPAPAAPALAPVPSASGGASSPGPRTSTASSLAPTPAATTTTGGGHAAASYVGGIGAMVRESAAGLSSSASAAAATAQLSMSGMMGTAAAEYREYKMKTTARQTDHPDFGELGVEIEFKNVPKVVEELSFIRLKIEDEARYRDTLAAWACIRLDRLRPGYRFIHLLDAKGEPSDGVLLVKIEKVVR